jgi:dolichyl-phosphate-mannose-protein mannosyltransferase
LGEPDNKGNRLSPIQQGASPPDSSAEFPSADQVRAAFAGVRDVIVALDRWLVTKLDVPAVIVLLIGLFIRLHLASLTYFDLDEAYHSRLAAPWFPDLWRTAHEPTHPPLLIFITHFVRKISLSEPALRMVSVVCGTVFPWFVYRWLGLVWTRTAGFVTLVILVFAPMLALLGAVLRQYALGLLLLSVAIYLLELSIRNGSTKHMWGFTAALFLAITAAFPTAFFCGALGLYVLLRFREPTFTRWPKLVWAFSQVLALAAYAHFLFNQILEIRRGHQELIHDDEAYFSGMFPEDGADPIAFIINGALHQFNLAFQTEPMPQWGLVLFALGLGLVLWSGRNQGWLRALALLTLIVTPFVLTCAASFTNTYPWGSTRQNAFLIVSVAIAVGIAVDFLLRHRLIPVVLISALIVPPWIQNAPDMNQTRTEDPNLRSDWHEMLSYLRTEVPGARLMVDGSLGMVLTHYIAGQDWPIRWVRGETRAGGNRWFSAATTWQTFDDVWEWLAKYQAEFDIPDDDVIYILDSNYYCYLCAAVNDLGNPPFLAGEIKRFGNTAVLIPVRAGYRPQAAEQDQQTEPDGGEQPADKVSSAS